MRICGVLGVSFDSVQSLVINDFLNPASTLGKHLVRTVRTTVWRIKELKAYPSFESKPTG